MQREHETKIRKAGSPHHSRKTSQRVVWKKKAAYAMTAAFSNASHERHFVYIVAYQTFSYV